MNGLFLDLGQKLASMLAHARPGGLTVQDLREDFLEEILEHNPLGFDLIGADPVPVFEGETAAPDSDDVRSWPGISDGIRLGPRTLVNLLPSDDGAFCCSALIVVSLSGRNASGGGHLKFGDALESIVRHAQGVCEKQTLYVVLFTDCWVAKDHQKWWGNLENIKSKVSLFETYLIGEARKITQIDM